MILLLHLALFITFYNMGQSLFLYVGVLASMFIIHELGHIISYIVILKKLPSIRIGKNIEIGKPKDYIGLKKNKHIAIYLSGIIAGFFPLVMAIRQWSGYVLLFAFYGSFLCFHDLERIFTIMES